MTRDFGAFQIYDEIGHGAMATVYHGWQKALNRKVAIKIPHPHLAKDPVFLERFMREAKLAAGLRHENIRQILDCGVYEGEPFMAMEFVDGLSLDAWQAQYGIPPVETGLLLLVEICRGLEYAHRNHVVHRDIKPANVMFSRDGCVKITDFGIARGEEAETQLTADGSRMGTPAYMSPEQARGERVDFRSDIFSTGVLGYELLGGVRPFRGNTEWSVMQAIMTVVPENLDRLKGSVPRKAAEVIHHMIEKDVPQRYPSMSEVLDDLQPVLEDLRLFRGRDILRSYAQDPSKTAEILATISPDQVRERTQGGRQNPVLGTTPSPEAEDGLTLPTVPDVSTVRVANQAAAAGDSAAFAPEEPIPVPAASAAVPAPPSSPATTAPVEPVAPTSPKRTEPPRATRPRALPSLPQRRRTRRIYGLTAAGVAVLGLALLAWGLARKSARPPEARTIRTAETGVRAATTDRSPASQASAARLGASADSVHGSINPAVTAQPQSAEPQPVAEPEAGGQPETTPPTHAASAVLASLEIVTDPRDARVLVDGIPQTPSNGIIQDLPAGRHRVRVGRASYRSEEREVDLQPGPNRAIFKLREETGAIVFRIDPPADIFVDGALAQKDVSSMRIPLLPGSHRLRIEHRLYKPVEWTDVRISAGKDTLITHRFPSSTACGSIKVTATGGWCMVQLDTSATARSSTPCSWAEIPVGDHVLTLTGTGFMVESTRIDGVRGELAAPAGEVRIPLTVREDARTSVELGLRAR